MTSFLLTPTVKLVSNEFTMPSADQIQVGDIVVVRYRESTWAFPWDDWHHVGIVSSTSPLTIIEAVGETHSKQPRGPFEVSFDESAGFGKKKQAIITKMKWLRPVFPHPIREIDKKEVKWTDRKVISEDEARKRVIEYARKQIGEPYKLSVFNDPTANNTATKWDENEWYCSLLIYKAYSRTITGMLLESEESPKEFFVTPEDIVESPHTATYFSWVREFVFMPVETVNA